MEYFPVSINRALLLKKINIVKKKWPQLTSPLNSDNGATNLITLKPSCYRYRALKQYREPPISTSTFCISTVMLLYIHWLMIYHITSLISIYYIYSCIIQKWYIWLFWECHVPNHVLVTPLRVHYLMYDPVPWSMFGSFAIGRWSSLYMGRGEDVILLAEAAKLN